MKAETTFETIDNESTALIYSKAYRLRKSYGRFFFYFLILCISIGVLVYTINSVALSRKLNAFKKNEKAAIQKEFLKEQTFSAGSSSGISL